MVDTQTEPGRFPPTAIDRERWPKNYGARGDMLKRGAII